MLRGQLDKVRPRIISGWAQDTARPKDPVSLIITNNDEFVSRVIADRYREDLKRASIGNGHHFFELELPLPLSPTDRHVIRVFREVDGTDIPGSPATLEPTELSPPPPTLELKDAGTTLRASLDIVDTQVISGWVHDTARPDEPLGLIITNNDRLVERILANRYREDLKNAGVGNGRHAFELVLLNPLSPFERNIVRIRRETDGSDIPGSPITLEPAGILGEREKQHIAGVLGRLDAPNDITSAVRFLEIEANKLKQRQADRESKRVVRVYYRESTRRRQANEATKALSPRALVIDDRVPKLDRDAGSSAIISHMESLQRLGYEIKFVPSAQFDAHLVDSDSLSAIGVECCAPPIYGSTEDVMRRQADTFDLVYLHRISNASKYLALARSYFPKARIVYSVADLHHIRLARQAASEDRPELVGWSKRVRLQELMAAASADAVITHSTFEAEVLRKEIRGVNVHVVPWSVQMRPTSVPFAKRQGLAFIGSFGHQPNGDAARWLITEIMPLVRQRAPEIECLLVGSDMPDWLTNMCGNGVEAVGKVDNLAEVFDRVRLTVAPLSYGAGVKGKVLESLAAGVPCVCTPVAAEGLDWPEILGGCVAESAADVAAIIQKVHGQKKLNEACRAAGLDYIASHFAVDQVDQSLGKAIGQLR